MKLYEDGIRADHFVDSDSGAVIFRRTKADLVSEENKSLKKLLSALVNALPKEIINQLPKDSLEVLDGN